MVTRREFLTAMSATPLVLGLSKDEPTPSLVKSRSYPADQTIRASTG
jgi:hypothetical protein